jgi:hypothetical protein
VAVPDGSGYRIEVDGRTHVLTREDGFVVRAGWPAFVVSVLVGVGDQVTVGQPVAVLETMKMESGVASPVAGEVTAVEVMPNAQVDAGAPLLRVRASAGLPFMRTPAFMSTPAPGASSSVDLSTLVGEVDDAIGSVC